MLIMAPSAAVREQAMLVAKKARLEQELKICRMQLHLAAQKVMKEKKEEAKVKEQAKRARKEGERPKMQVDKKTGGIVGWSQDGKVRFGPGYECWQCMHRARGGKGGHKHTCDKVPYAR